MPAPEGTPGGRSLLLLAATWCVTLARLLPALGLGRRPLHEAASGRLATSASDARRGEPAASARAVETDDEVGTLAAELQRDGREPRIEVRGSRAAERLHRRGARQPAARASSCSTRSSDRAQGQRDLRARRRGATASELDGARALRRGGRARRTVATSSRTCGARAAPSSTTGCRSELASGEREAVSKPEGPEDAGGRPKFWDVTSGP